MNYFSSYVFFIISLTLSHLFDEIDYVTVPPGADPAVSAEDGGNGFEEIAESLRYQTSNFTDDDLKYFYGRGSSLARRNDPRFTGFQFMGDRNCWHEIRPGSFTSADLKKIQKIR